MAIEIVDLPIRSCEFPVRYVNVYQRVPPICWVKYYTSLAWNKAIWGWFPVLTMIPGFGRTVRSLWNWPRSYIYIIYLYHISYIIYHHISKYLQYLYIKSIYLYHHIIISTIVAIVISAPPSHTSQCSRPTVTSTKLMDFSATRSDRPGEEEVPWEKRGETWGKRG